MVDEKPLSLAESIRRKIAESKLQQPLDGFDQSNLPDSFNCLSNRYKLSDKLEDTGKTEIFVAKHVFMERQVVVEILKREFAKDKETLQSMLSRARELSASACETEYGELCDFGLAEDGRCYLVFSKSSSAHADTRALGESLADRIRQKIGGTTDS